MHMFDMTYFQSFNWLQTDDLAHGLRRDQIVIKTLIIIGVIFLSCCYYVFDFAPVIVLGPMDPVSQAAGEHQTNDLDQSKGKSDN